MSTTKMQAAVWLARSGHRAPRHVARTDRRRRNVPTREDRARPLCHHGRPREVGHDPNRRTSRDLASLKTPLSALEQTVAQLSAAAGGPVADERPVAAQLEYRFIRDEEGCTYVEPNNATVCSCEPGELIIGAGAYAGGEECSTRRAIRLALTPMRVTPSVRVSGRLAASMPRTSRCGVRSCRRSASSRQRL